MTAMNPNSPSSDAETRCSLHVMELVMLLLCRNLVEPPIIVSPLASSAGGKMQSIRSEIFFASSSLIDKFSQPPKLAFLLVDTDNEAN